MTEKFHPGTHIQRNEVSILKRHLHPMFTRTLFIIAKMWRRSTRSLRKYEIGTHTDTHTHTEFYSAIKKVGNPAICDNMNEL